MITCNSISGGKTSAYMAVNFPTEFNNFCLVTVKDKNLLFPDKKIRQIVSDKINKEFIGTVEDNLIIYTILELEQYLGKKINWLAGEYYEDIINTKGGWLPNKLHRYCTTYLKIDPQVKFWYSNIRPNIYLMNIGFRQGEEKRLLKIKSKLNENGNLIYKASFEKHKNGKNKWQFYEWQKPNFPLIYNQINKIQIENFWKNKPVKFAAYNNCVGCFHRNPLFLNKMYQLHPEKIKWFADQENEVKGTWRNDTNYKKIMSFKPQFELQFDDFGTCDTIGCTD